MAVLWSSDDGASWSLVANGSPPDPEPATLALHDVNGRELDRRSAMGAGHHVVTLGTSRALVPGVYLVQLIRRDRRLVARAVIVQ